MNNVSQVKLNISAIFDTPEEAEAAKRRILRKSFPGLVTYTQVSIEFPARATGGGA